MRDERGQRARANRRMMGVWLMVFALANGWRVLLALQQLQALPQLATAFDPRYVALTAGAWALVFAILAVGWLVGRRFPTPNPSLLGRGVGKSMAKPSPLPLGEGVGVGPSVIIPAPRPPSRRHLLPFLAMLLYQAHQWLDVALFARSQAAIDTLGYRALLTTLAIGVTALLLWLSKGKLRSGT